MKKILFVLLISIFIFSVVKADEYNNDLSAKINNCLKISKHKLQTGLWLNPPGSQTYYERSKCFRDLAVEERQLKLCSYVKQHYAKYLDGSKYSIQSCNLDVSKKIAEDKKDSERYLGTHQIKKAFFDLNGNERDFDFTIETFGDRARPYKLILEIYDNQENLGILYSDYITFSDKTDERFLYIPRKNLLDVLKERPADKVYQIKLSLILSPGRFIAPYIPVKDRLILKIMNVNFAKLIWKPVILDKKS